MWPDMWTRMSDAVKKKAKQRWAIEKPKLDNARQLRGIYFIEPDDEEFKPIMKAARKKLEVPMQAAMLCKTPVSCRGETCSIGKRKTKYACVVDADESTRPRLMGAGHKPHQVHFTAKGTNSTTHYTVLFTNSFRCFKHSKFQMQRRQWRNNGTKLEKIPAFQLTKVRNKKDVIKEARDKGRKVHFASLMDLCHLEN